MMNQSTSSLDTAINVLSEAVFIYDQNMQIKCFNSAAEKITGYKTHQECNMTAQATTGILLTPGPTPVPPEALRVMAEPIFHHRTPRFQQVLGETEELLKKVGL